MMYRIYFLFCIFHVFCHGAEFIIDVEDPSFEQEAVFNVAKTVVKSFAAMQNIEVHGLENFVDQLASRNSSIITFANHQSEFDDPLIWSPLNWDQIDVHSFRWVLAAREQLESNAALAYLVPHIKTILINRKLAFQQDVGLHQMAMVTANQKLANTRSWIHIFPEGRVFQDYGRIIGKFRPGLAHLIMSCDRELVREFNEELGDTNNGQYASTEFLPILVPVAHFGMHNVKPLRQNPSIAQKVHIFYGDSIDLADVLEAFKAKTPLGTERRLDLIRKFLTDYIETVYIEFYLHCYQIVYGKQPIDVIPWETGYFENQQGIRLAKVSKNILTCRSKITKLSCDKNESSNYRIEMERYIAQLKNKGNVLSEIIKQGRNLSAYDNERLSYNLFGMREALKTAEGQLSDGSGCL